jgi:hypothetical protein
MHRLRVRLRRRRLYRQFTAMQRPGQLQVPLRRGKLQGSFSTAVSI